MPFLETPPDPAPPASPPPASPPVPPGRRPRSSRYSELEHHELLHLLDEIDDERARARFRESVYISTFVCLALAWFIFFGPKVLFHQGRIILPQDVLKQRDRLTYLDVPKDLSRLKPKTPRALSDHDSVAQTRTPSLDRKTLEQLQAMRRAGREGAAQPKPLPPTPQPQQTAPAQQQPAPQQPPQQAHNTPPPKPLPPAPSTPSIPDAPRPTQSTRPNFSTPMTSGDALRQAAEAAARNHGDNGEGGANRPLSHQGANTGLEVLSDTQGVDFGPYLRRLKRLLENAWYPLIPEECYPPLNKEGQTMIRFTIKPNGVISFMHLDGSTRDVAIDKAAWGSITSQGQLPPLPSSFHGDDLTLRITFIITHDRGE